MSTQPIPISYPQSQQPLTQLDENGNPIVNQYGQIPGAFGYVPPSQIAASPTGSYGGSGVYGSPVAAPAFSAQNNWNIDNAVQENQNFANDAFQQVNQEAQGELGTYGPQQTQFENEANAGLNQLAAQPGYTPGQESQINTNYSQFNTSPATLQQNFLTPTQQTDIMGDPSEGSVVTDAGLANEGSQLGAYGQDLSGQVGNFANYTKAGTNQLDTGLSSANQSLASGLEGAQSEFGSLNQAVTNPALGFDPNSTEQQITPAEMQQMQTNAGEAVGAQYQTAEDQLQQQQANAGNTSPLAIAAANARLQQQQAAGEGNAESNAAIAALQAQEQQASSIEQQREAAADTQSGLQAQAATTEQSQAQQAAALAGTEGVSSAGLAGTQEIAAGEAVGQTGLNAANQYGTTAINEQNQMTGQQYSADTTAEQLAQSRANELALNQQGTQEGNEQTQYNQGVGSAQATAGGAQTVGAADIAGKNTYLQGVQNEQSAAQSGGQNAVQTQLGTASGESGALNQSTSIAAGNKANSPTVLGEINSTAKAFGLYRGGIVDKPEVHLVGEKGPEIIMPTGRYRAKDRRVA